MRRLATLSVLMLAASAAVSAADTHPFSVHDMIAMDRISDPQISPDANHIAFVVSALDLAANKRRTDLYLVNADGSGLRRMTSHEASDTSPRWSPDGRTIYFLSTRSGSSQVWKLAADGGEATAVTKLPLDVGAFLLSPDGSRLAVAMDVFPACAGLECTTKRIEANAARKSSGLIFDSLFIRHWDTWSDGRRSHWFVLPVAGGDPVDLMRGMDADGPSKPFGGTEEAAFTPDGKSLVFAAKVAGREEAWSTNFDLFVAPVSGAAAPKNLTASNRAWDTQPVFSPDGKTLAYLAMSVPGYEADRYRVILRSWPEGKDRVLAEAWDRSPSSVVWSPDGKTLYAPTEDQGQKSLFALDVASGSVRTVVKDGTVDAPLPAAGDRILYLLDTLTSPAEIFSVKSDGTGARAVTHFNDARVAAARIGKPEQFSFKGWNDETVYAYAVQPADFSPAKKYPVAFLIHGGPQSPMGNHFHYRWNPQAYAGAGYGVVVVEFHGTPGYGQAFTDSIQGDWGGKPLMDLQKGLAAAIARYSWMDGNQVCALGASFGGYMINWIAGNWPDRFRCLVSHDGNLDERMAYYDTEELWFPERDHRGTPWNNPESYERQNPANFVRNWKTPMLVIHGGKDFRVVETQGFGTFNALQRRGIPSKFLYFPDENHWVLKPQNSILWHETVIDWLDRWAKGKKPRS
ncbi:MAG: peptidase S9 [Acidobacteria bacterium]|nr:MAG: peptidase S9 [Acidobacteriota bacterium]